MKKLSLLLILLHSFIIKGQCDLEILGYDINTGDITIVVNNSENCGCNEFTSPGTTCQLDNDEDNNTVYHLNMGIHFDSDTDPPPCSDPVQYFPGWWFLNFTFMFESDISDNAVTGDTLNFSLAPDEEFLEFFPYMWDCWQSFTTAGMDSTNCVELVIWQINYSQTADSDSLLGGYQWTDSNCGLCADQTQSYPDINNYNNVLTWCGDELPPPPIYVTSGCTDPDATNYDPDADTDDGSCEYPSLTGCQDPIACNYNNGATNTGPCVYCNTPNGEELCNAYWGTNYWNFYSNVFNCDEGCTDPMACNYNPNAIIDDGSCAFCDEELCDEVPAYCYGCTDPIALNYEEDSQIDDGTCVYSPGPDLIPIEVIVTDQDCLDDNETHIFYFQLTVVNIGDEDVGEFCYTTFLTPNQWNCPTTIDINPGDTATFNGTFQANWISGQSNYVTLNFVEGLNGEQEIITGNNNLVFSMPAFEDCSVIEGCMDECALNYNPDANEDDGSCEYYETIIDTVYVELPPDTLIQIVTEYVYDTTYIETIDTLYITLPPDTVTITETEFVYDTTFIEIIDTLVINTIDTLYVELPPDTITLVETEFVYDTTYIETVDTLYVELPPDTITVTETEFIFITDTIYETEILYITDTLYITLIDTIIEYQFIEIDCSTGLPCGENPGFNDCDPLTVYIPNTFTPNNDGYNDAWEIVLFPECWAEVDAKVYNRWGGVVWESVDPYSLIWEGGFNDGDYYVPDGVYYWTFNGRKAGSAYVEQLEGHVTIFR